MPYSFDQSEPTIVAASHHPFDNHPHLRKSPLLHNMAPARAKTRPVFSPSWTTTAQESSPQQTLITKTSRKRSRDDAALNVEEVVVNEQHYSSSSSPLRAPDLEEGWQYGEGMVLIKPNNSFIIDAGSQPGTWAEKKAAVAAAEISGRQQQQQQNSKPILPRNNKSQRLDHSSTATSNIEETPYSSSSAAAPNHPSPKSSSSSPSEPAIDDFTIHLGIGWSRISTQDLHIQAAARGWAKYIENNYPNTITSPIIRLESKGLNSYLVEAAEGFFLFGEDLKQGRLVSRDLFRAVQNLRVRPPLFDSDEVLTAAAAADSEHENVVTACERDECVVTNDAVPISVDIEMDLN